MAILPLLSVAAVGFNGAVNIYCRDLRFDLHIWLMVTHDGWIKQVPVWLFDSIFAVHDRLVDYAFSSLPAFACLLTGRTLRLAGACLLFTLPFSCFISDSASHITERWLEFPLVAILLSTYWGISHFKPKVQSDRVAWIATIAFVIVGCAGFSVVSRGIR